MQKPIYAFITIRWYYMLMQEREITPNPAENLLIEKGVFRYRSAVRQQIIGCIGCRFLKTEESDQGPNLHGFEISRCLQIQSPTVYPILKKLVEAKVVRVKREEPDDTNFGRPLKNFYTPADTVIGRSFHELIEVPQICGLDDQPVISDQQE